MKIYYILINILISLIVFISCNTQNNEQKLTKADSIWLKFAKAMESKDTDFLINNSLDTVSCFDCNIDTNNEINYFDAGFIFKNHIDKIMHLKSLSKQKYSTYEIDGNLIKIVYTVKSPKAPEGRYSLIFTLIKNNNKYYFQGMTVQ